MTYPSYPSSLALLTDEADRARLDALVGRLLPADRSRVTIIHLGDIVAHAPAPPKEALFFHVTDPTAPSRRRDFNIIAPDGQTAQCRPVLVVYAPAIMLALWDRLEEDVDEFLRGRQRVIFVFLQEMFVRVPFGTHSHFLSAMLSGLPARKFTIRLTIDVAPEGPNNSLPNTTAHGGGVDDVPQCFSALVISVTPRQPVSEIVRVGHRLAYAAKAAWLRLARLAAPKPSATA